MTRKRRIFDIDVPDDGPRISSLDEPRSRRGPMASAIAENSDALSARATAEATIRAENDALAHEYVGLKRAGLVARMIPLDDIVSETLVRDRASGPDAELEELVASIKDVGLSNPIRVEAREDGKFELIQGFRRLSAYRVLRNADPSAYAKIPANVLPHGEGLAGLYRQMVDENLVRKDLSFAEMASVAQAYAADPDTGTSSVDDAVAELFKSAAYNKRSYIRSFAHLLNLIGSDVSHPEAIPRNLGLDLVKLLKSDDTALRDIKARLGALTARSADVELAVLREVAGRAKADPVAQSPMDGQGAKSRARAPRTTFEFSHDGGRVKCTASVDQLTLKLEKDLTSVDRDKLETGLRRLLQDLE